MRENQSAADKKTKNQHLEEEICELSGRFSEVGGARGWKDVTDLCGSAVFTHTSSSHLYPLTDIKFHTAF